MILNVGDLVGLKLPTIFELYADISDIDVNHPQYVNRRLAQSGARRIISSAYVLNFTPATYLLPGDVALVISISNNDCQHVYVIGPRGPGWTYGAVLFVL